MKQIKIKQIKINPNNEKYYSSEFIKGFKCGAQRQFDADMADRKTKPQTTEPNLILPSRMERGEWYQVGDTIVVMNCDDYYDLLCKGLESNSQNCSTCKFSDRYGEESICHDCSRHYSDCYQPKDEPQTCSVNGRPYDCGNCEYFRCTADEPQTERSNKK